MALNFPKTFIQAPIRGLILKELIQSCNKGIKSTSLKTETVKLTSTPTCLDVHLSLAALNINSIRIPPCIEPPKTIIPPPVPLRRVIELPQVHKDITFEDQSPIQSIDEPSSSAVQEKQAARLIVIRRKKMKKHKLKKLRKKMKFVWAKARLQREKKKEKEFQAHLLLNIKEAQMFDPAKYAAEKIAKAKEVELPQVWYGVKYPEHIIKQLIEEQEMKRKEKEADEKRRASMSPYVKDYLDKLPK